MGGFPVGMRYDHRCPRCERVFSVHDVANIVFLFVGASVLGAFGALVIAFPPGSGVGAEESNRWFGVAFVIIMEVGLLTPPVGLNLYVIYGVSKNRPFSEVAIGSAPFFVVMLVALALVHAFPELALWLPSVLLD